MNVQIFGRFDSIIDTLDLVKHQVSTDRTRQRLTFKLVYRGKEYVRTTTIDYGNKLTEEELYYIAMQAKDFMVLEADNDKATFPVPTKPIRKYK